MLISGIHSAMLVGTLFEFRSGLVPGFANQKGVEVLDWGESNPKYPDKSEELPEEWQRENLWLNFGICFSEEKLKLKDFYWKKIWNF